MSVIFNPFAPKVGANRRFGWLLMLAATTLVFLIVLWWPLSDTRHLLTAVLHNQPSSIDKPTDLESAIQTSSIQTTPVSNIVEATPDSSHPIHPFRPTNDGPVAVIVETQLTDNLVPLILHFASVLGPTWKVILFTPENGWKAPNSAPWHRIKDLGQLEVRFLQPDIKLTTSLEVSHFLTSPWLWEQIETHSHCLLFQLDSILCSKSERRVEDFFEWDYVGAPIAPFFGIGYNGGLSLRNPKLFLQVSRESTFDGIRLPWEDQWFYSELRDRGANLPDPDTAVQFAVETINHKHPLGYHQPQRWHPDELDEIRAWCPEIHLLAGPRAIPNTD